MNNFSIQLIIQMIAIVIIVMVLHFALRKYVFPKLKVNKIIVGIVTILLFLSDNVVGVKLGTNSPVYYILMILFLTSLFYFFDAMGWSRNTRTKTGSKNDITIRPKAKPNRVKNMNKKNDK
ncbi:MAG: amino acid permease [Bacillota bacterium]|nr:amino acid permease [Bacillota bacterium]